MYKVTINGAHCIRQTIDHALEVDGKGDEIYFSWSVAQKSGATSSDTSKVYGDTNGFPQRILAGDVINGDKKGIRTGNIVPFRTLPRPPDFPPILPWFMPAPAWSTIPKDEFPLVVWQGDLVGDDQVAINILLMEWDGSGHDPRPGAELAAKITGVLAAVVSAAATPVAGAVVGAVAGVISQIGNISGLAGDRPVGVNLANASQEPLNKFPVIALNAGNIEQTCAADSGFGPGVYRFLQKDRPDIGSGEYAFYVQISKAPAGVPIGSPMKVQDQWRWCKSCEGLYFGGRPSLGICPKGGAHVNDGSGNYRIAHNDLGAPGQTGWRWCHKCEALFFPPHPGQAASVCPAGGSHDESGSGVYTLLHGSDASLGGQGNWKFCFKCAGIFFNGHATKGVCPAGGAHDSSKSGNYWIQQG